MFLNGFKVESCKILDEFCIRWLGIYSRQNGHSLNDFLLATRARTGVGKYSKRIVCSLDKIYALARERMHYT